MLAIFQSEFVWGIILGLLLSFIGAWAQANITASIQQKSQKTTVVNFCADTIRNLQSIIDDLDTTRERSNVIHSDLLALIDVEIGTYGRNREHLIHLPDEQRVSVRRYMNDVAIKKAAVAGKISQFLQAQQLGDQIQSAGNGPEAQRQYTIAAGFLTDARAAADKLAAVGKEGKDVLAILANLTPGISRNRHRNGARA